MKTLSISYFASLREQAGRSQETLCSEAATPAELYRELQARYGFSLDLPQLRFAIGDRFVPADTPLGGGERIVVIPPVSGG